MAHSVEQLLHFGLAAPSFPVHSYDPERDFVMDDPMAVAEGQLRARSLLSGPPVEFYYAPATSVPVGFFDAGGDFQAAYSYVVDMEHPMDSLLAAKDEQAMDIEPTTSDLSPSNSPRSDIYPQRVGGLEDERTASPRESERRDTKLSRKNIGLAIKAQRRAHKGAGMFTCPASGCDRSYRRKGDLKVHCKKKHNEDATLPNKISKPRSSRDGKAFPCPEPSCPCGFMRQRGLIRHYRKKHPDRIDNLYNAQFNELVGSELNVFNVSRPVRMSARQRSIHALLRQSGSSNSQSEDKDMEYESDFDDEAEESQPVQNELESGSSE
jgi:hypothetical protein